MGEARDTAAGEVVYLLAELRSAERGAVYEIGSRARVLDAEGEELTLAVTDGSREDVVTCRRAHVTRAERSLGARRRVLRGVERRVATA
jgi:hypothetical protein